MDYLDVTLNFLDGSYKPFHKSNSEINYIHKELLNHIASSIKQWRFSDELRLSKLSSDENVFIKAVPVYQKVIKQVRYSHKLSYNNSDKNNSNKNNKDYFSSNDQKNNNNYNNEFMINANHNWDNNNNNKKQVW